MEPNIHPLASHDLPSFITAPGETDTLLVVTGVILLIAVIAVGVLYFNLHSLPERMSHRTNRVQVEIVAVLCLLALFTHNHLFWIVALLLAFIRIPDFETPLNAISDGLKRLADRPGLPVASSALPVPDVAEAPPPPAAGIEPPAPARAAEGV
jgi:hypothetical protein